MVPEPRDREWNNAEAIKHSSKLQQFRACINTAREILARTEEEKTNTGGVDSLDEIDNSSPPLLRDRLGQAVKTVRSRRDFLKTTGKIAAVGTIGISLQTGYAASYEVDRSEHTILEGTQYETTVHSIDSPNEGRTMMILGGVHGNELGGIGAAHYATNYEINRGSLVVIPETNKAAVEMEGNHGPEGDLNRQFPIDEEPTTEVARGVWEEILSVDPEFILDMHNASTLKSRGSVGQGIFPTSGVVEHAENAAEYVNAEYLDERIETDLPEHPFQVGNTVTKDRPRLIHKAAADQNIAGWTTEVTRIDLSLDEREFLQDMLTRELLRQVGIDVGSEPELANPL